MIRDSISHAREDIGARQLAEAKTEAMRMVQATEKVLHAQADLMGLEERQLLAESARLLREAVERNELSVIQARMQVLDQVSRPVAERVMDHAVREALVRKTVDSV